MNRRFNTAATRVCGSSLLCGVLFSAGILAFLSGCADDSGRFAIAGTVTYQGEPLESGNLVLRPLEAGQTTGTKIEQGSFRISRSNGLLPGKYRVEIKAMRAVGEKYIDSESGQEEQDRIQFIPRRYNTNSELVIEVTAGNENTFPFELTKAEK